MLVADEFFDNVFRDDTIFKKNNLSDRWKEFYFCAKSKLLTFAQYLAQKKNFQMDIPKTLSTIP